MEVYHLGLTRYAEQLTGEGAKLFGGRWNKIGQPCIYAAESKALCVLEYAANVALDDMPDDLSFTTYFFPNEDCKSFAATQLPADWMATPAPDSTKEWGNSHLQTSAIIRIPSVVIPSEHNFLFNPLHANFKQVRLKVIEPFTFDRRIKM